MNTESDSDISVHLRVSTAGTERAEIRHVNHDLQMEDHGPSLDNLLIERADHGVSQSDITTRSFTIGTESGGISTGTKVFTDGTNTSGVSDIMTVSTSTIFTSKAMCVGSTGDVPFTIVSSLNRDIAENVDGTVDDVKSHYLGARSKDDMFRSRRTDYNGGESLPSSQMKLKDVPLEQMSNSRVNRNFDEFDRELFNTSTPNVSFEIECLQKELSSLQKIYHLEKDLLSVSALQQLRREHVEFAVGERNDFSGEVEYLRALIDGVRKEIDYLRTLGGNNSEMVSKSDHSKFPKVKTEYSENIHEIDIPVSVSNLTTQSKRRLLPSFGNEHEYLSRMRQLERQNKEQEERIIALQDKLFLQTIDVPKHNVSLELSQGRDVSDSQEQRLLLAMANESSDESKFRDSVNSNSSVSAQVSSSLSYQNVSLDDSKYTPDSRTNSSRSSNSERSSSVERKPVRIKREPSISHESSVDNDCDSKQMSATPVKGIRKHSSDEYRTRRSSESSKHSDSDSEKYDKRKSRHKSSKDKRVSFQTKRNDSESESEEEQRTPPKDSRKRRHSRPRIIDESDSEQTPTKRSLSQLDKYDGTGSLEVFLRLFDNCSKYYHWSDREKLSQLIGALRGNAAQVLLGGEEVNYSYKSLREELQKCFGNTGQATQFRIMLRSRRRQANESLQSLYQDVCRLLTLAYPGPRTKLSDDLSVDAFTDSLNDPDLQQRVRDRFPSDLAEAYKIALSLEANTAYINRDHEAKRLPARHYRSDLNARAIQQDSSFDERLGMLEERMKSTSVEADQKEKQSEYLKMQFLENRVKELETKNRNHKSTRNRQQRAWRSNSEPLSTTNDWSPMVNNESSVYARMLSPATPVMNVQSGMSASNYIPTGAIQFQNSNLSRMPVTPNYSSTPVKSVTNNVEPVFRQPMKRLCHLCSSPQHLMANCPQALCRTCKQYGHTYLNCAVMNATPVTTVPVQYQPLATENEVINNQRFAANIASARNANLNSDNGGKGTPVFLEMECLGIKQKFLLDSGCDMTLLPAKYVRGVQVLPSSKRVFAANATEIELMGEVNITLRLGDVLIPTTALISDNVTEGLIGYDWLSANDVFWGFGIGRISIAGKIFPLQKGCKPTGFCRRIVVQQTVTIPPMSESVIPSKVVFTAPELSRQLLSNSREGSFILNPTELSDRVYVSSAVVPNRCHNIPTRILNRSCRSIKLMEDDILGELQPGEVVDSSLESEDRSTDTTWLDKLLENVDSSVNPSEREKLRKILESYTDCFSTHEFDLGRTQVAKHRIDTGLSHPIRQPLRRHPPVHLEEIDRQVKDMLAQDVIEPSSSPWASNVVVVKKKDGSLRFCIDYRKLNDVTVKDSYPLPKISDCLDALSGGKFFSAFDLRSGYFQVEMEEADKEKTSFVTRSGLYHFKVMPFGCTNGPATFQRLMNLTLAGLNYKICLVYLDDIILMSSTVEEHLERLVLILERLRSAGLKLKPSKCKLLQKRISFLGHVVSDQGVETDHEKIRAVAEWPTPKSVADVRSYVGLCSYYRRFVKDFAAIAGPLHALTGKNVRFQWTTACQESFDELKRRLISSPILAMPQDEGHYKLDTDASNEAIGAVLSQVQDGQERVVAYASRLLTAPEKNYCVTRRELLAIVYFIKQFRPYLLGKKFLIRTDHAALRWLRNMPEPIGQQARWLEQLEEYDFEIEHRPGKRHANADAMSRRPCKQCNIEDQQPVMPNCYRVQRVKTNEESDSGNEYFDPAQLCEDYTKDYKLSTFHAIFSTNSEQVPWSEIVGLDKFTKNLWNQWDRLSVVDGVLYRKWVSADGLQQRWQLVPPKSVQNMLIKWAHTGMTGGHLGIKRTQHQLQLRAYWPEWAEDVARFCRQCPECATYHRGQPKKQGELQKFPVGEPFERLAIDLTGPHPTSRSGHVYILTVIDLFTKWGESIPLRNKEAITVARALMDVIFSRFGLPLELMSDNGREFDNSILKELCRLLGMEKIRTTVYKPSTNGAVERFHRTLNSMLGKVVETNQRNWDEFLPSVMAAYRASRHESTGYSPNFLCLGRENRAPLDVVFGLPEGEQPYYETYDEYAASKVEIMRKSYQIARDNLGVSAERAKHYYDLHVKPNRYNVGQWVYYYCPRRFPRRSPKWQRMFTGPFLVTKVMGPVNVKLQASKRSQPFIVHIDKLKQCLAPCPESWLAEEEDEGGFSLPVQPVEDFQQLNVEDNPEFEEEVCDVSQPTTTADGREDNETMVKVPVIEMNSEQKDSVESSQRPASAEAQLSEQTVAVRPRRVVRRPDYLKDYATWRVQAFQNGTL